MKKLLYYIVYSLWYLLSLLPLRVLYWLSDIIFVIVFYILHYRRRTVWVNLVTAFPERDLPEEHSVIERNFYRWFCDYLVESVKLMTMSPDEIKRRLVFKNTEVVDKCISEGQSRMRNFQRQLVKDGLHLKAYPFSKILDVDHASDIEKAEAFLNE